MGPEEPKTNTLTIGGPGVTSQQSIVRLIDGADMRLSPGKHGQTPGARADHNVGIMGNYFDIYTIRDNTRITTAPGSPPSPVTQLCQTMTRPILFRSFLFAQRFEPTKVLAGRCEPGRAIV